MSPNLNDLQLNEEPLEVAPDSDYPDPQEFPPPLPPGVYLFTQGEPEFGKSDAGFLKATFSHMVADGEYKDRVVREFGLSDKPFERSGRKVTGMKDHLRAVGIPGSFTTHADYATALTNATGRLFKAATDWEGSCESCTDAKGNRLRVRGARNFPVNGTGEGRIPEVLCPGGCGQKITAFSRITRRIPASG